MTVVDKDFKVKNGLIVSLGATFGGTVTVATPTALQHAATKEYVDNASGVEISETDPEITRDGQFYLNSLDNHMAVSFNGSWIKLATFADTADLRQHIHDTAIDGTGLIVTIFQDAGYYNSTPSSVQDAGSYLLSEWGVVFDGGVPTDNFN
jgi:hypothetical protein